jgi:uncharacterized protein YndB with AHSA1/START domain
MASGPTFTIDRAHNSLTITADLRTDADNAWDLWANARTLEQWWGPPEYPCAVTHFELRPGGSVTYVMTGPDGTKYPGWWEVISVDAPRSLTIRDGFGESPQQPSPHMPNAMTSIELLPTADVIHMKISSQYASPDEFQSALDLGMQDGFMACLRQIAFLVQE